MNELLLLFGEESPVLIPTEYVYVEINNNVITFPIYALSDIDNNVVRIYINGQIRCFNLVDLYYLNASEIMIFVNGLIKCFEKI